MLTCKVCPHLCELGSGDIGKCLVRSNIGGKVKSAFYGQISVLSFDQIEKRPFFHFCPGQKFLSVGFVGCQLSCQFCQNFSVSQSTKSKTKYIHPEDLLILADEKGAAGIVWTYNEPTVHYEYISETEEFLCQSDFNLKLAIKTNGFANHVIAREMGTRLDAINVDLKGDDEEYKRVCGGRLQPVLDFIRTVSEMNVHVEISYLVLPRMIEDFKFHRRMRDFLFSLNSKIPVHVLNYFSFYKMEEKGYAFENLVKIVDIFKEKMIYVYISNLFTKEAMPYRHSLPIMRGRSLK